MEITSRPESFYRAGRRWTKEKQVVPQEEFTKKQIEALKAEPNLVVHETTIEVDEDEQEGNE